MTEPTKEQLEMACDVYSSQDGAFTGCVRDGLRLAAPYLQLPWGEPTEEECGRIARSQQSDPGGIFAVIFEFVRLRNAALLPKPVDPRADALHEVLVIVRRSNAMSTEADFNKATSDILRLLDEREISLDEVK